MPAPDSFGLMRSDPLGKYLGPALVYMSTLAANASDANDLPDKPRMLHVSTAGTMKLTVGGGTTGVIAWEVGWHPVSPDRIWAASLTAVGELYK